MLKEKKHNYYEANKVSMLEKKKLKCVCECGFNSNKDHLTRHRKTKLHKDKMSLN